MLFIVKHTLYYFLVLQPGVFAVIAIAIFAVVGAVLYAIYYKISNHLKTKKNRYIFEVTISK